MHHLIEPQWQVDLSNNQLCGVYRSGRGEYTVEGITAIANAIGVSASLTAANLKWNSLDVASKQLLQDAVKSKSGFKLEL